LSQAWIASLRSEAAAMGRWLEDHPAARRLLAGTLSRQEYVAFMLQTYHYVRWTTPLLRTAAHRLGVEGRYPALARLLLEKVQENGHERWALSDLAALGWPEALVLSTPPSEAVSRYVEWNRRRVEHGSPLALLGSGYVLQLVSNRYLAQVVRSLVRVNAIRGIRRAVRFFRGHLRTNAADLGDLETCLGLVAEPGDREAIVRSARATRRLYSAVFASLSPAYTMRQEFMRLPRFARRPPRAPRRPRPDPFRVFRHLLERLVRDQGLELICRSSGAEMVRTKGAGALLGRWFPEAPGRSGLPGELHDVMDRLTSAPPGVRESRWVRRGEGATLRVTFLRANQLCAAVFKEIPLVPPPPPGWRKLLTARELEVAAMLLGPWDYAFIAGELGCRPATVTKHTQHIFDKLGVPSRAALRSLADRSR